MVPKNWICTFRDCHKVSDNSIEAWFDVQGEPFIFRAGQYIRLTNPRLSSTVKNGNTRDFTISSIPKEPHNSFAITFTYSNSAFKEALMGAKAGDSFLMRGPSGVLVLPENPSQATTFIAFGIGVTPFVSMCRYSTEIKENRPIHLIYAESNSNNFCYLKELEDLSKKHTSLKITLHKERHLTIDDIKNYASSDLNRVWYLCGPSKPVMDFTDQLPKLLKVPLENIRTEEFIGYNTTNANYWIPAIIEKEDLIFDREKLKNDNFLNALLDAIGQTSLISITNLSGDILYVNSTFIRISKYSKEELIGENHRILKSGYHPPEVYADLWKTISSGKTWRGEIKNRAKDGSYYWVDSTISPVFGANHQIEYYLSVRVLKENLNDQKVKFSLLLKKFNLANKAQKAGIFEFNPKTNEMSWDEHMYQIFDAPMTTTHTPYELWESRFNKDDKPLWDKLIHLDSLDTNNSSIEFSILLPNQTVRYLKIYLAFTNSEDLKEAPIIGVCQDITKEKKIDQMKTEFVSLVAHQLKAPLASISSFLQLLLANESTHTLSKAEEHELTEKASHTTTRAINLVTSFLNVSKIETDGIETKLEPVDLKELLDRVISELKNDCQTKEIELKIDLPENFPHLQTDPKLLGEVFLNLISNAIKYSHPKSEVLVKLSRSKDHFIAEFIDHGPGIPEAEQAKMFQKFARASNVSSKQSGSGLGLYTVKCILEALKGSISFQSKENAGTTFRIELPL